LTRDVLGIYRALEAIEVAFPSYMGTAPPIGGIASGRAQLLLRGRARPRFGFDRRELQRGLARSVGQRRRAIILLTDGHDHQQSAAAQRSSRSSDLI